VKSELPGGIKHILDVKPVAEAHSKLQTLRAKATEISKRMNELTTATPTPSLSLNSRAEALVATGELLPAPPVSSGLSPEYAQLADELSVTHRAIAIAEKLLSETKSAASAEICAAVAPQHKKLVLEMHGTLVVMVAKEKEYREFRNRLEDAGVSISLPNLVIGGGGLSLQERLAVLETEAREADIRLGHHYFGA